VIVHTDAERAAFLEAFEVPADRVRVAPHGEHFTRRTSLDRVEARRRLGIPVEDFMFLSLGFIQPHKGFDRAIRAFAGLGAFGCRLDVVGSVRVEDPAFVAHLLELEDLARATSGVTVHEQYVSDEEFDRWLVAADVVVLPYRHIWSSGVIERAALYDRPVIASRVGGLDAQARQGTVLVSDDEGLARAMWEAAGRSDVAPAPKEPWAFDGAPDRETVMAEIVARAAAHRGVVVPGPSAAAASSSAASAPPRAANRSSAPLRRVPSLNLPSTASARFGAGLTKRLVRRLTAWELQPIVEQVNVLQRAAVEAAELAAREADE
jgi:hypothetical protein